MSVRRLCILLFFSIVAVIDIRAQQSVIYQVKGDDTLRLDVYRPEVQRPDSACVVFLHGGAFRTGSRDDSLSRTTCTLLAQRGFVAFSVDYRLTVNSVNFDTIGLTDFIPLADTVFRCVTEDCSDAVAFVAAHADEFAIDTSKIVLAGSSAGAIAALQTDCCRANGSPWAASLPVGLRFAAVVSYSGAVYSNSGAVHYDTPPAPTCFFHGTKDRIVTYRKIAWCRFRFIGSSKLAALFNDMGYTYHFYRIDGHTHDVSQFPPQTIDEFVFFVDAALRHRVFQYETDCLNVDTSDDEEFSHSLLHFVR